MKSTTLEILQTVARVGKTLCRILFPLSVVGFCLCIAAIVSFATMGNEALVIGDIGIYGLIRQPEDMTVGTLYATLASGAVLCAGIAVLTKFIAHYLRGMLADGTPFTLRGARALLRAGILMIVVPIASGALIGLVTVLLRHSFGTVAPMDIGDSAWGFGIMMIILSLVCRLGAEQLARPVVQNDTASQPEDPA